MEIKVLFFSSFSLFPEFFPTAGFWLINPAGASILLMALMVGSCVLFVRRTVHRSERCRAAGGLRSGRYQQQMGSLELVKSWVAAKNKG